MNFFRFSSIVVLFGALSAGYASAGALGSSAADAAYSAQQLKLNGVTTSGLYWFDSDGAGGANSFQAYADMTTNGGGWMLVRHVAGTGGWINVTDNLNGSQSLNLALPNTANNATAANSWSLNFADYTSQAGQFMFSTGDNSAWGSLSFTSVFSSNTDLNALNAQVLASSGLGVAAGGYTNVLNRSYYAEDPWIGFEGTHSANLYKMMYGEAGWNGYFLHSQFKNAHDGINVWIRETTTPVYTAPVSSVPEPESMALFGIGLLALALQRRRQKARSV